jgi:hypothetical protein
MTKPGTPPTATLEEVANQSYEGTSKTCQPGGGGLQICPIRRMEDTDQSHEEDGGY